MAAHGGILVADGASAQNLGAAPVKLTCFATDGESGSDDYGDQSVVPDSANDQVLVREGRYKVDFKGCAQVPAADDTYKFSIGAHGNRTNLRTDADNDGTLTTINVDIRGFISITKADLDSNGQAAITVYGEAEQTRSVTFRFAQLNVIRLEGI